MSETRTIVFADGMSEASIAHGVARITLAQTGAEGKPVAVGQLCIPLGQLPGLANSLINLLRQVEARSKAAQAGKGQQGAEAPEGEASTPDGTSVPSAFRFSG